MSSAGRIDVVVIGAGPYGLAAASHIAQSRLNMRVFGAPMSGWVDHMPAGMYLKSTALDSNIGAPEAGYRIGDFCAERGITPYDDGGGERPIPIADFVDYGRWYQERLVPGVERAQVTSVSRAPGGFRLELDTGESLVTASVVVAAGVAPFPNIPEELRPDGSGEHSAKHLISHTSDHADLSLLAGRKVAIVGAGQSALESAVLLHEAGATVHLIAREPELAWAGHPTPGTRSRLSRLRTPPSPLGAGWVHLLITRYAGAYRYLPTRIRLEGLRHILGPFGAWWLHQRYSDEIDTRLDRRVVGTKEHGDQVDLLVATREGSVEALTVDHVIAATGYKVDVGSLEFLEPELRSSLSTVAGSPSLSAHFESSVPGLYFSGLAAAATFGPMLRFVYGSKFAAERVAAGVAHHAGR